MRARPQVTGDQLVQEYLTQVTQAARLLPKGTRMAFVGRTRALLEREIGPTALADPDRVMAALERLGKPEDLVREERTLIDRKWVKSRAPNKEEGEAAAAALTGPRMNRSLRSRRRLGADSPLYIPKPEPPPGEPITGQVVPPPVSLVPPPASIVPPPASIVPPPVSLVPPPTASPEGTSAQGAPDGPGPNGAGPAETGPTGSLDWLTRQEPAIPLPDTPLANAGRLAREHLLESTAALVLGLGGALLPFPFWAFGAILALFSRLWDIKDKALAIIGPVLVTLVISVVTATFLGGNENFIVTYSHALRLDFSLLVRLGCVVTAAYLAWRVSRGPRVKVPPWRRVRRVPRVRR
jgi:hypothetical protein